MMGDFDQRALRSSANITVAPVQSDPEKTFDRTTAGQRRRPRLFLIPVKRHDSVTDRKSVHVWADGSHDAGKLMAKDGVILDEREGALPVEEVAIRHSARIHTDKHILASRRRRRTCAHQFEDRIFRRSSHEDFPHIWLSSLENCVDSVDILLNQDRCTFVSFQHNASMVRGTGRVS